ncbi:hypothetical protein [Nonomuraea sp. NPDC023979]|uniref:hypothetical protein n=1 Tax=Nonomuraea sp. NPDC023979 TaxID=3154796 RepID=UPI0033D3CB61
MTPITSMTATPAPAQERYLQPYLDSRPDTVPDVAGDARVWPGPGTDTLPLLSVANIRSMERLRFIHDQALQGIAEITQALDL